MNDLMLLALLFYCYRKQREVLASERPLTRNVLDNAKPLLPDDGSTKATPIPSRDVFAAAPPRGGIWKREAPNAAGSYSLVAGPWYCVCFEFPAPTLAPTLEQIAAAFMGKFRTLLAWDDPDQQQLQLKGERKGFTLSPNVPVTRELAPGRVWVMTVPSTAVTLRHERVVECWRRFASDVVGPP